MFMWIPHRYGPFVPHKLQFKTLGVCLEASCLSFHTEYKTTKS